MNRYDYEKAVYESDLDAASKQILAYYGYKKHWNDDGKVWTSAVRVSKETGLSLRTIKRKMPVLRELGWLVDTGQRVGNGTIVYDLSIGTSATESLVEVISGTNQSHSGSTTSATMTRTSATVAPDQCHSGSQRSNTTSKEEVREEVTTDADAPVVPTKKEPVSPESSLTNRPTFHPGILFDYKRVFEEELKRSWRRDYDPERVGQARGLMLDASFKPKDCQNSAARVEAALEAVGLEETW